MKRFFKLVAITMQSRMYYRTAFLLNLLTPLVLLAGQFLLWRSLYLLRDGEALGSYAPADMFSYILVAFFVNNLLTWASENALSREIRSGAVVTRRLRPVSFLSQSLAEMLGNMLLQGVVNLIAVGLAFVLFARHLTLPTPASLLLFIPSLVLAMLLRMMISHFCSLLCFFTTSYLGISWTRQALMEFFSGALIPVALFPAWLKSISYALPFPYILQIPVSIFLGQALPMPVWRTFAIQFIWVLFFLFLHVILYGSIRKRTTIAGG